MAKRGKLEIIRDILLIIKSHKNFIKSTPLLRQSNLSSSRFKEYLHELIKKNFVKEIIKGKEKGILITERGFKFIEGYKTIINFIDEFEL